MEVPGSDSDWRSPQFRSKVVAQIEDAMRKAGTAHSKSSTDMENHVYIKAKSREEYLSLVARLIIHFRDFHKKNMGGGPDPMNALTNLAGVGPRGAPMTLGPQQHTLVTPQSMGGPMVQQMQMQVPQQAQFQQFQQNQLQQQQNANLQQQFQQQQLRAAQLQQQHHPQLQHQQNQNQAQNQMHQRSLQQQQMVQLQLQQAQSLQQHMVQQQQGLPPHSQAQGALGPPHTQPQTALGPPHAQQQGTLGPPHSQPQTGLGPPHSQQALQQGTLGPPHPQQQSTLGPPHSQQQSTLGPQAMGGQMGAGQHVNISLAQQQVIKMQAFQNRATLQQQAQLNAQQGVRPGMPLQNRMPRAPPPQTTAVGQQPMAPQVTQHMMSSSPSPLQAQTPQNMPPPPQPSPQPPTSQPNSASSGPTPSPGGFQPSPSPQPSHSPATARTPQNYSVASPGPLNTPGNPSSVMSPAGTQSLEDQQYMEKLKQLSKFVEPLSRMINKIDKNEDRKKDLSKMKSLLNILTDPNTRCPLKTLEKCEIALEKLKNDMAVPTPPPPAVTVKQQYLCQPLLDAVMVNLRSLVFNHSLYRTFAPPMTAIHGPPIIGPHISGRKRKMEEEEKWCVSNLIQGEVARLDVKFSVNLDSTLPSNNGTLHLLCRLDDKSLPSVPPLQLSVPADYPQQSPQWSPDRQLYEANSFLKTVHKTMTSKLLQLPDQHSLTELLQTWAQSVRQATLSV